MGTGIPKYVCSVLCTHLYTISGCITNLFPNQVLGCIFFSLGIEGVCTCQEMLCEEWGV